MSDISLSPAWSVMIIFLWWIAHMGAVAGAFGQAAWPDRSTGRGQTTVKDLSREATAGGRRATKDRTHMTSLEGIRAPTRADSDVPAGLTSLHCEAPSSTLA